MKVRISSLRAAGMSSDQIIAALEHEENERIAERRERDRIRKRNQRSRPQNVADSADIADNGSPPSMVSPITPSLTTPSPSLPVGAAPKIKTRATRLPPDWKASEADIAYAQRKGLTPSDIQKAEEAFRDHWWARAGPAALKMDWPATWRTWIRRDLENAARRVPDISKSASAAAGRLAELARRGELKLAPRPRLLPVESTNIVELLPPGRGEQPGNVHDGDSGGFFRISEGNRGSGERPQERDSWPAKVPSGRSGD